VEECSAANRANDDCIHVKTAGALLPRGGDIVFAAAHQHAGGIGSSLYGQVMDILHPISCLLSLCTADRVLFRKGEAHARLHF
jgi:hypothetical protein